MPRKKKDGIFVKNIDRRRKSEIAKFLKDHFRYSTMQTWKTTTSYANDVRLPGLDIPPDKMDLAMSMAKNEIQCPDWDEFVIRTRREFYDRTGWHFGFNGKHCGYIVLYPCTQAGPDGQYEITMNRAVDQGPDFKPEEWPYAQLKDRFGLVQDLDETCEAMRLEFLRILDEYEVVEVPVNKKLTQKILQKPA